MWYPAPAAPKFVHVAAGRRIPGYHNRKTMCGRLAGVLSVLEADNAAAATCPKCAVAALLASTAPAAEGR